MTPLAAVRRSPERRHAAMAAADWRCQIDDCSKRASYVVADGRVACGECATPSTGSTFSDGGAW